VTSAAVTMGTSERGAPPPAPVSFEEFLAWTDEDTRAEWVDGEIVLMSPSSAEHQLVLGFLYKLVDGFVLAHQLGTVLFAPFLMRLTNRPSGREPDLLFIATAHADRLRETYVDGPADLVVEIVSPESDARDRGEKLVEYEAAGIPEYWLLDPLRREAAFLQLGEDRRYHPASLDADRFYHSAQLPGFRFRVAWLWQRPLPTLDEIERETARSA
jgi:Uma2 family endonuclease